MPGDAAQPMLPLSSPLAEEVMALAQHLPLRQQITAVTAAL